MVYKINTDEIKINERPEHIFYATHDIIIYQDGLSIVLGSRDSDEILTAVNSSYDYTNYECVDLGDSVLIMFDHKSLVLIDKNGMKPISYMLDEHKIGNCLTRPFLSNNPNRIIFGTKLHDRLQFVNFDFMEQKRVTQSSSWKMSRITDLHVNGMMLYATLDNSFLVCCDMTTGETLWTRFETGKIGSGLITYGDHLYYCCQGILKKTDGKTAEVIRIPFIKPVDIVGQYGKFLFFTNKKGNSLCQYNLDERTFTWEIFGSLPIKEVVTVFGVDHNSHIMFLRTSDYISIVDTDRGQALSNIKIKKARRMRLTEDHILVHKHGGGTMLIPGLWD